MSCDASLTRRPLEPRGQEGRRCRSNRRSTKRWGLGTKYSEPLSTGLPLPHISTLSQRRNSSRPKGRWHCVTVYPCLWQGHAGDSIVGHCTVSVHRGTRVTDLWAIDHQPDWRVRTAVTRLPEMVKVQ